ncbi:hypothetical protein RB623_13635 [Mesorhizobium sp. LHD-90]|uniref:hypothetical protein n=1 Tax=Mesorhizobium sp. LHD-90 TaxID=3071414 RepID=UPI0027E05D12|nr:hypothetical protein [Mesorhizobium sp. LHD-90]MDQ6435093.1 hypothetical protein [Mesorhizobium sp. LHD-90]
MRTRLIVSAATLLALTALALAKAPADIADLVGARAPGAESEMQNRGYTNVKNNTWWNAGSSTCVRVHVSQGKYSGITQVKPSACGHGSGGSAAVVCPPDLSQADLYKHPGCSL